jgi:chromosomal replication initiator protein
MNTRQIEGVIKKIHAYVNLQNKTPTISVVQSLIRDIMNDTTPEPIKIEEIVSEVSKTFSVSERDIISKRKTAAVAFARQVAMYIARETTELSYKAIGDSFGKDHTTVLHNVQKIENHLNGNPFDKELVENIIKNLQNT